MSNTVNASGPLENSSTLNPTVGATSAGPAARRAPLRSFMRSTMEVLPLLSRPTIRMFTRCFFVARKLIRYEKNPMAVDEARAIIFVVDSADTLRLCVAKDELDAMLASDDVAEKPILVFANKADVPSSLSPVDVAQGLSLEDIETNPWQIVPSNALDGTGLQEGVDWLTGFLAK